MRRLLALILLFVSVSAVATDEFNNRTMLPPISISNAIQNAMTSHPQARIATQNIEVAQQEMRGARSALLPVLNASGNYSELENPVNLGVGQAEIANAGLSGSQPLLDLSALYTYRASKLRLLAAGSAAESDQLRVASQAASTYFDVLKLRITLDLAKENYTYLESLLAEMRSGDLSVSANDIKLVEGAFGSALTNKHIWIQEKEIAENNFERDILMTAPDYFLLEPTALVIPEKADEAIKLAIAKNPALAAAQARKEAKERDEKAARMSYLPRADLSITTYDTNRPAGDFSAFKRHGTVATVTMTMPLFGGRRSSNLAREKALNEIAALTVEEQLANLTTGLENTYARIYQRTLRLQGLCRSLQSRVATVESMKTRLTKDVSVQDFLYQKDALLTNAISLNNEFLSDVLDSYSVNVQIGTLLQSLPAPMSPSAHEVPNPQIMGVEVYNNLLTRCVDRKLL